MYIPDDYTLEEIVNLVEDESGLAERTHEELLAIETWLVAFEDVVYSVRYHVRKEIKRYAADG